MAAKRFLTTASAAAHDLVESTGSLGAGFPSRGPARKPSMPKKQPPLLWKAFGFFLKNKFSSSGSLLDADKALFFADPDQPGIPEGAAYPNEVTNYQLFQFADTMQRANKPSFSLSGGSSYFEFLNLYLRHVGEARQSFLFVASSLPHSVSKRHLTLQEDESPQLTQARETLLRAKQIKDEAWEDARARFAQLVSSSSPASDPKGPTPPSLIEYYLEREPSYISAFEAEAAAQKSFAAALSNPAFSSVLRQLDLIRLADMRLEPQAGNTMPVLAVDRDWITFSKHNPDMASQQLVDAERHNIYYRPAYGLSHYETTVKYWIDRYAAGLSANPIDRLERDGPYTIPLADVWERSWADLGHPLLDQAEQAVPLTDERKELINSLTATVTFLQRPFVGNVSRGMWDVNDARERFDLGPSAPQSLRETVYKTSKLIIAWGIEMELTVPEDMEKKRLMNITLAGMDLPFKTVHTGPQGGARLLFRGGGDGFPILLGAFADMV
ncbi:hypothetical protein QBC34DRAFT_311883 [Podospora aff. communis PSN243]|uniref:Uncharacterized protein n=1 Tax=Podospora aff. communis PSN243 TaxID=3040156 RepID=A0AAV9G1I9_9PEZI|nr:hypothetical protein QBC34DRAFT_311883 [Podospora aff. communis PSN243]